MTTAELAALITAIGMALAGIITAIAALKNANANMQRIEDLRNENEKLRADNDVKTLHNEQQDAIILNQQIKLTKQDKKIQQWHDWGERVGRMMNQMQIQLGALEVLQARQQRPLDTAPLRTLPHPDHPEETE